MDELLEVLRAVRDLLARLDNNFSWSSWPDREHALAEIDRLIRPLQHGFLPPGRDLDCLFMPTGPVCEVAVSSGWGDRYDHLANRMEHAVATARASVEGHSVPSAMIPPAFDIEISGYEFKGRGPGASGGEVGWSRSLEVLYRCVNCGETMTASHDDDFACRCHAMHLDVDAGRFGSWYGDQNILVYSNSAAGP